jgi:DNA-binding transcriptional LysR family regulator
MTFNLRLLRVFLVVARSASITRAAAELGLTQPAVSRAMRELETQTRTTLLERAPTGVRLTQAGEALLAHARIIFAEARAAEEDLDALDGLTRGTLRLGASPTIATYLVPPLLHTFNTRYPGVELRLTTAPSRAIARLLIEREIDAALVETLVPDPRLVATTWAEDELVLVAAPTHPILARAPVPPAALAHELLVIREPRSGTHDIVLRALHTHGVVPMRRLEVDTAEAIIQLVASGLGVAIVSRCAADDALALRRLAVVEVTGLRIRRPLMQLALAAAGQSAAARAFSAVLEARAPSETAPAAPRPAPRPAAARSAPPNRPPPPAARPRKSPRRAPTRSKGGTPR